MYVPVIHTTCLNINIGTNIRSPVHHTFYMYGQKMFQKKLPVYCIVLLCDWKNIFFRKQKMKQTTINVLKRCQCLFLNIISILYSNNGDFGLHPQIIRIRIVKTKNSALKSDNAQHSLQFLHSCVMCITAPISQHSSTHRRICIKPLLRFTLQCRRPAPLSSVRHSD